MTDADEQTPVTKMVEDGHYYSPLVDTREIGRREPELWPAIPRMRGVDYREPAQHALFEELVPLMREYDFPSEPPEPLGFFRKNWMFSGLDAVFYFGLLRKLRPQRLLEIGCGFSTMLAVETRERFLGGGRPLIACIDPYPTQFRAGPLVDKVAIIQRPVWEVEPRIVDELEDGDVFFVDCSHVSKTGADTHTVYFDLLPRLAPGVYVQIHDIALPFEYPQRWVVDEGRHWNEQYLLQALLTDAARYEVVFGSYFFSQFHADAIRAAFGIELFGGSFWLRVRPGTTPRR